MAGFFRKIERGLFHLLGPAQVDGQKGKERPEVDPIPDGYERRGTPGNYYIVPIKKP